MNTFIIVFTSNESTKHGYTDDDFAHPMTFIKTTWIPKTH